MSTASKTQPPPVSEFEQSSAYEAWLERNFKKLLVLTLVFVLAVAAYFLIRLRTEAVAREAGAAFTSADTVEALDAVISKYPGSLAAANSLLKKAELLWGKNQKDSAVGALRQFLESFPKHPLAGPAKLSLGSRLEEMGEKAEARKIYEELVTTAADSEVTPLAELRIGDLLWSEGKLDEAKAIYSGLPAKYPGTNQPFFEQSQERLKWASADLPTKEVDPPPPPPAPEGAEAGKPKEAAAAAPGAATLPPINLSAPGAPAPVGITVTPEGGVTTAPVEVKADKAAPAAADKKPAQPKADESKKPEEPKKAETAKPEPPKEPAPELKESKPE